MIQPTQNRMQWNSLDSFIDGTLPYSSKNLPDVPISKVVQATYQKWLTAVNCCLPRLKVDRVWPEPMASVSKRDFLEILESVQIKSIWRVHNWAWFRLLSWSIMIIPDQSCFLHITKSSLLRSSEFVPPFTDSERPNESISQFVSRRARLARDVYLSNDAILWSSTLKY